MKPFLVTAFICLVALFYGLGIASPHNAPFQTLVTIDHGDSLQTVATKLYKAQVIQSPLVFKTLFYIPLFNPGGATEGDYFFENPENAFTIAKRIIGGSFGLVLQRITIPEGYNKFEIGALFDKKFSKFNLKNFLDKSEEGYLFPDTYFVEPNATETKVISLMENNFHKKISTIEDQLDAFDMPLEDIIKMASIVETEARLMDTRRAIAGILWKRISLNMPLQVDVTFKYINGKNSSNLTVDDLAIDSPYNTYKYKGLPKTPIANPGLDSILATITPIKSDNLYFLSDKDGVMHYAATFDEHKENRRLYLR